MGQTRHPVEVRVLIGGSHGGRGPPTTGLERLYSSLSDADRETNGVGAARGLGTRGRGDATTFEHHYRNGVHPIGREPTLSDHSPEDCVGTIHEYTPRHEVAEEDADHRDRLRQEQRPAQGLVE